MTDWTMTDRVSPALVGASFEHHRSDASSLVMSGPICARTSAEARAALWGAIEAGTGDLVLHLGRAEVWDATGFGVIVGAHHRATQRGRRLVIADASPRLLRLVRRTRLERLVLVSSGVSSGRESLGAAHHELAVSA